jgi:rubrerythrin
MKETLTNERNENQYSSTNSVRLTNNDRSDSTNSTSSSKKNTVKNRKTPIPKFDSKFNSKKQKTKNDFVDDEDFIILGDDDDNNGRINSSSSGKIKDVGVHITNNDRTDSHNKITDNNQNIQNNFKTAMTNDSASKSGWVCTVCTYVHSVEHTMYLQCAICATNRPATSIQS